MHSRLVLTNKVRFAFRFGYICGIFGSLTWEPELYPSSQPAPEELQQDLRSDVMDTLPLSVFDNEATQHFSAIEIGRLADANEQKLENASPSGQQYTTTYDDLRRRNRLEYHKIRSRGPSPAE